MKKLFIIIILGSFCLSAQSKDPDKILDGVKKKFSIIKDYSVNVEIKLDVSFLKVPDTKAKIYYKQPDKVKIESPGFALLPKKALDISPTSLLKEKFTAFFDRFENYDGILTAVVKTIPLGDSEDIILSTFWIDYVNDIIRKAEISTKINGTFIIEFKYDDKMKFQQLPISIVFSFDIGKLNIPKRFSSEINKDKPETENYQPNIGRVFITYSNYVVNEGIPDSVFNKPNENSLKKK